MRHATLPEIRELARRSRATQRIGLAALVVTLLGAPLTIAFGARAAFACVVLGGAMLVAWARFAGQERGAYRALLREMKKASRE
jgi:hypothetical protein